ncbi:MAG: IS66 family transposase [Hydrogenophaga sp.]|nr:IS66 family transposase [Hydrogenophaga sp.]MDZ4282529.1 IS66 family transposase [Hydrogenophaga sp.]
MPMVVEPQSLQSLSAEELRELTTRLMTQLRHQSALLDKLTHENALLKRMKFAAQSERFNPEQKSLLEDEIEADLAAVATEIDALQEAQAPAKVEEKKVPKRAPLPANLPRREIRHEPESTLCQCGCQMKRVGEDVAEKLDYVPGVFTVERHIRGKWACAKCETLTQVPVDPHVIDKGIPTTGLLAQVLVAKYADHLPLYRQEAIFGRAGLAIPRSTLAQWVGSCGVQLQPLVDAMRTELLQHRVLHADETPVSMLKPGNGKTHRAYLWAYATGAFENTKVVVYDFCESRSGEHARRFLGDWRGSLTCDDFSGYKALIASGVTEVGCLAHARRKFFDLHAANQSQIAEFALQQFGRVYEIEREVKELSADQRRAIRQQQTKPLLDALHQWMLLQRPKVQQVPRRWTTACGAGWR